MINIKHIRFAADQMAWSTYEGSVGSRDSFDKILCEMISFHQLDICPSDFDLVYSLSTSYYQDISARATRLIDKVAGLASISE